MRPYRTAADLIGDPTDRSDSGCAELWFVAAVVVPASIVRLVGAIARHESFGVEATLALFIVLAAAYEAAARIYKLNAPFLQ